MNIHLPHKLAKKLLISFTTLVALVLATNSVWAQTPTPTTRVLDDIPVGWTVTAGGVEVPVTPYYDGSPLGSAIIPEDAVVVLTPPDSLKPRVKDVELLLPEQIPLTFEAKTAGAVVSFGRYYPDWPQPATVTIEYSKNGSEWATYTSSITLDNVGDKVSFRGNNTKYYLNMFYCSGDCYLYGNIMSLISSEDYATATALTESYAFAGLFSLNSDIYNHASKKLVLPATTLSSGCYSNMFNGCTGLTAAPELPANTMDEYCYYEMFKGCSALTIAPELPAEILAKGCYSNMFSGCTSLTHAPALPVETLAEECYTGMFYGCTSLEFAPALPAMTMTDFCYQGMFDGCSSLTTAPALPATTLATQCYNGMFSNCTSLATAPALPATTLANFCYDYMFNSCTSLTATPVLPATTLSPYCYQHMFLNCSNLNNVTCLAINISATGCTNGWLDGVAETGTFIKPASMTTWPTNDASGIPVGWTTIPVVPGKFSVNANGDQVYFSQGNLQATTTDLGANWSWSFAENQWDYIGNAANNCISGNGTVSTNGTVDLFGWVGANSSWAAYGINNSQADGSYGNVASEPLKSDWGHNVITNGGNAPDSWRTLTKEEWVWIIGPSSNANPGTNCRTSSTVGGTANARFTYATINGTYKGMIIFPDSYTAGTPTGVTWGTINNYSNYTTTCTTEGWAALEAAGCVFLPAAGVRGGNTIYDVASRGNYWSSTSHESYANYAYSMHFFYQANSNDSTFNPANYYKRSDGYSIRLVRTTKSMGSLSYASTAVNKIIGDAAFSNPLTFTGDGTVSYARSAGDEICTVDASTGEITLNGTIGSCTITATVTEGPLYAYNIKTASYTLTVTPVGALPGKFSVNANGDQIFFSQGNLQYQASTNTWRFAEHQWDYVGDASHGNVYENEVKCNNANISDSYTGWIDLFGWGTGNAPTKATSINSDYSNFTDWGVNPISNGGNTANQWRTLTNDEWGYLFNTRTNAANLRTLATVNGVTGLIVMPDGWNGDLTITLADYSTNTLTQTQWESYEVAGCIFLPIAGHRYGTSIYGMGSYGNCWSSTSNNGEGYDCVYGINNLVPQNSGNKYDGRSIRLVCAKPFLGAGTAENPYLISSEADWNYLAQKVNSGTNYSNKFFRQTANISVTTMVGIGTSKPFSGTYDGNGDTLHININTNSQYAAPFQYIENATIKNVVTTGTVHSTSNHPSGLVGITDGTCTIQNCLVSANVGGAQHSGGIVGHCYHANISIIGCVYSGTLSPASGQKTGGILGWGGDGGSHTITISDCLFAGSLAPNSNTQFHPIGIVQNTNNTRLLSNTYYTVAHNMDDENTHGNSFVKGLTYKGKFARSITAGTGVTVAYAGTATAVYDVSGITSYGTGILYNDTLYAGDGEEISLTLSHADAPSGTTFSQYIVTGGGTLSNPTSNSPTLTMTDANQVINAEYIPQGAINGKFTINASGDQVYFSKGNLQATTSNKGSTWTWAFATNQWDYIGNAVANNSVNGNGTVATNGTVDLFGWSTAATTFGILNSTSSSNYSGDFVDWGSNIGTGWRTLTSAEWAYLFTRTSNSSVNGTSNARYAHATINTDGTGVNGLILFPDGVTIANNEATSWGNINATSSWAGATKCTSAQWTALAAKGCVFLPTAGLWFSSVDYTGTNGYYWSSSPHTQDQSRVYSMEFLSTYLYYSEQSKLRSYRCSVRLVRNANVIDLSTVTSDTIVPNGWTITGTLGENHKISIAAGATVTLDNVTINRTSSSYPGITCEGSATINLVGENTVNGGSQKAGILIGGTGTTLTINGPGSLSATGGTQSAGIGLSRNWGTSYSGGNIVINGGTITAKSSGVLTSGIGTGCAGSSSSVIMGDITINGGTVIAYGAQAGAGIGTGFCYYDCTNRVGNITITGGSVTVTGGANDAANPGGTAIGAGPSNYSNSTNEVGNITISGGTVTATCGTYAVSTIGKSSEKSVCGDITFGGAPTTPTITLNNPNNSGEMVSARSFMNPGTNKHLSFPEIEEFENAGFTTFNGFTIVSPSYGFQCGCFSVTQFKYVPYP